MSQSTWANTDVAIEWLLSLLLGAVRQSLPRTDHGRATVKRAMDRLGATGVRWCERLAVLDPVHGGKPLCVSEGGYTTSLGRGYTGGAELVPEDVAGLYAPKHLMVHLLGGPRPGSLVIWQAVDLYDWDRNKRSGRYLNVTPLSVTVTLDTALPVAVYEPSTRTRRSRASPRRRSPRPWAQGCRCCRSVSSGSRRGLGAGRPRDAGRCRRRPWGVSRRSTAGAGICRRRPVLWRSSAVPRRMRSRRL